MLSWVYLLKSGDHYNVGTPWTRRLPANGSPPNRASPAVGEGLLAGLGERDERGGVRFRYSGRANTNIVLLPVDVVSSGVIRRKLVPCVMPPAAMATYWRPFTL